jgi:hypothetical protein
LRRNWKTRPVTGIGRASLVLSLTLVLLAGCPGKSTVSTSCPKIPGCSSACCNVSLVCKDGICNNVVWGCRVGADGVYQWVKDAPPCSATDLSVVPGWERGVPNKDTGGTPKKDNGLCPQACGAHASCVNGTCQCDACFTNPDNNWANGCEQAECQVMCCGGCSNPATYCGANAECRNNQKCRCVGQYTNPDNDWSNGCEQLATDCSITNCNKCSIGFCGSNADCMQNNCKCNSGWSNGDGQWGGSNGCECSGNCNGTTCVK